jgi:LysM repeat protein
MKQNERLLVYAVTGFLALILVIAVLFGNDPVAVAKTQENTSNGLSDILQPNKLDAELAKAKADADAKAKALSLAGQLNAGDSHEQPLNAKPYSASDVVVRVLGKSRRERMVRWVPVKRGDAFEKLVRRWCGDTQDNLEEALQLNEDTTTLNVGSEVMVPWVADEVLAAIIEAQGASSRTLVSSPVGSNRTLMSSSNEAVAAGMPGPSVTRPGFKMPGFKVPGASNSKPATPSASSAGSADLVTYTVKKGDSIWRIATKRYGKAKAYKMVKAIQSLNPNLGEVLDIGQEFKIPAKAE